MKFLKLVFIVVALVTAYTSGFKIGSNKNISLPRIKASIHSIYTSTYDNPILRHEVVEEFHKIVCNLVHMTYFDKGANSNDYRKIEEVISELLFREISYCAEETSNIDTSLFLEAHLSVLACLINSSEANSREQKIKIAMLASRLNYAKKIDQQVFDRFLENHVNEYYYSSLVKSLEEFEAEKNSAKLGRRRK